MAQDKYEYMSKCPHFFPKKKIIIKTPPYIYYLIFVIQMSSHDSFLFDYFFALKSWK